MSPSFARSIPSLGPSVFTRHLHPRVSADREDFGTLDNAGVDEDDLSCGDFSKAEAFVDEPLVNDELHDFDPVCVGVWEAGFALFVFQLGAFLLQPRKPPDRHIHLHVEHPLASYQKLDNSADLAQVLSKINDSLLLCRGLEV